MSARRNYATMRGVTTADRLRASQRAEDVETYGAPSLDQPTRALIRTCAAIVVAVAIGAGLGIAGTGDYRAACEEIAARGASDSADALQCARDFPSLFPYASTTEN